MPPPMSQYHHHHSSSMSSDAAYQMNGYEFGHHQNSFASAPTSLGFQHPSFSQSQAFSSNFGQNTQGKIEANRVSDGGLSISIFHRIRIKAAARSDRIDY